VIYVTGIVVYIIDPGTKISYNVLHILSSSVNLWLVFGIP